MQKKAFTLVEVVVALAIFSTSIMLLSQSFVNALMCKQSILKEDDTASILQILRASVSSKMSQESASNGGMFMSPINNAEIKWKAFPQKTQTYALFEVKVTYSQGETDDKHEITFLLNKENWLLDQDRSAFLAKCMAYKTAKQENADND